MSAVTASSGSAGSAGPRSARAARPGLAGALQDGLVITKRNLMRIPRVPELLVFSSIQPIMFVLLFAYVFGSAIPLPGGGDYKEFLLPGIFVQTVAFTSATTAVGMAEDMSKGLVDRFRSLPIARSAVVVGRTTADLANSALVVVIMSITGLLVGWSINNGFADAVAAYLLLFLFSYAMSWVGCWIGLSVATPEVANTVGFIWLFPLTFLSNAFVPTNNMPGWLQAVADWNPVSCVTSALRNLFGNPNPYADTGRFPMEHPEFMSLVWIAIILAAFVPLAVNRYRSATSR